jgi:hypothetical protein
MSKNSALDLEDLDIKPETDFMKWLKRIAYIVTILVTLSGGVLGVISFVREVKDPKAQAGYEEHSKVLDTCVKDVRENREEIRYLYRALLDVKKNKSNSGSGIVGRPAPAPAPGLEHRMKALPKVPEQRIKKWDKLQQRKAE